MKGYIKIPGDIPANGTVRQRFFERPGTRLGGWAVTVTVIAFAAIIAFPLMPLPFRQAYPVLDSWVMPTLLTVLVDAAALLNILAVWRGLERCIMSSLALVLSVQAALFITAIVLGDAIVP